jgi:Skp family chaperone for outer membrane proteins
LQYRKIVSLASSMSLVCLAVLCCSAQSHAGEAQKLAVVNVSKVFEKYNKVADVQKRIDAIHEARKKELDARGKDLADRGNKLSEFYKQSGQSEQVFDAVQQLRKLQFLYERDVAQLNDAIQKDYTREMREVLSDIRQAIKTYAEAGGFELVLRSPDSDNPDAAKLDPKQMKDPAAVEKQTYLQMQEAQTLAEVLERFNRNPVLFGAETADITDEVLKRLNDSFLKRSMMGVNK